MKKNNFTIIGISFVIWAVIFIPAIVVYVHYGHLFYAPTASVQLADAQSLVAVKPPYKPRYAFIDLGANSGDSCRTFLQDDGADVKFNFPAPEGMNHSDAEIYLFEANPSFNVELLKLKQELLHRGINIHIFPSTPVWVEQKTLPFYIDKGNHHAAGSSIDPSHPDPVNTKGGSVNLTTISIAHFLLENFVPEDFVVVKMDIELAEYTIVPHMADLAVYTVMDYLFVEWHNWLIPETDPKVALSKEATQKLLDNGVKIPTYNSPTRKR